MSSPSTAARWWIFTRERYEPFSHLLMAVAFALGNAGVALAATDRSPRPVPLAAAVVLAFLFFLRLRVFDELKDFDTDTSVNPERPLARGLIGLGEARRAAGLVALGELAVAASLGAGAVLAWALALAYSLAMFVEFGVGAWLRPRLELYAVTHTLVAAWLGLALAVAATGVGIRALPMAVWLFAPANWAAFNVFEFSRKTFAAAEERDGVPTYSSRLGSGGAAALSLTSALVALVAAWLALAPLARATPVAAAVGTLGVLALATALPYAALPRPASALALRGGMTLWALAFYACVATLGLLASR